MDAQLGIEDRVVEELRTALARPLPEVPPRWLYEGRGAALFDAITRLPEYYQTRAESALLARHADAVLDEVRPRVLAELGAGDATKIRTLLDADPARVDRVQLLDINGAQVGAAAARLATDYPGVEVRAVEADLRDDLRRIGAGGGRLILFLGGTFGNLHPGAIPGWLGRLRRQMAPGDALLLGVDTLKSRRRLEAAYNDAAGVTAAFNRNVLDVLDARFGADFDPDDWVHRAAWDPQNQWIEMQLRARRPVEARVRETGQRLRFARDGALRTEVCCKYTRVSLTRLALRNGWTVTRWFTDAQRLFALALLRPLSG